MRTIGTMGAVSEEIEVLPRLAPLVRLACPKGERARR